MSPEDARARPVPAWQIRGETLSLARPLVMGIVNVTPDSFSDGGRYLDPAHALRHAERLVAEGAGMLDVGGESTRPGAVEVPEGEELARVVPVIRLLRERLPVPVSVDTRKPAVARAALDAGAAVVNDVTALAAPEMRRVVAEAGAGVVLMHMRGDPQTMQRNPSYGDVVAEVAVELRAAAERAREAGIADPCVVLDPGIGFGKTLPHNLELIRRLGELVGRGYPVLLGPSRKAFLGTLLGGAPAEERATATAAACVMGLVQGARIFRVHDVRAVREALTIAEAIQTGAETAA